MSDRVVEMYVDPACPWAWLTSRWLLEAERVRPFTVVTRVFSLAEVNRAEGAVRDVHNAGERALRVLVAARRAGGEDAIRALYTEIGEAVHERGEPLGDVGTLEAAARAAGVDPGLVEAALADETTCSELLAEHADVAARGAFGVPALSVDGSAPYFGPVIDARVDGEEAGELWDIMLPLLVHPRVFELKRTRTGYPQVGKHRLEAAAVR